MKKLLTTLALVIASSSAFAFNWWTPMGMMSNTCVAPTGQYMTFGSQSGLIGSPCQFYFANAPYIIYYGTFQ